MTGEQTVTDYRVKEAKKYLKGQSLNIAGSICGAFQIKDPKEILDLAKKIFEEAIKQDFINW